MKIVEYTKVQANKKYMYQDVYRHPYIRNQKRYPTHRLIPATYLLRELYPWEVVHHINENPSDNRIENLVVFIDQNAHSDWHLGFSMKRHSFKPNKIHKYAIPELGIVLYGPKCKEHKQRRYKMYCEMTKRARGLIQ